MRQLLLITMLFCLCAPVHLRAQVTLSGQVAQGEVLLPQASVKIFSDGKMYKSVAADRKGNYRVSLPFGGEYELVFHHSLMVPVKVVVNTQIPHSKRGMYEEYEVPLNMKMFYFYAGLYSESLEKPIGLVSFMGEGRESFQFTGDKLAIEAILKIGKQSEVLYKSGKRPVEFARPVKENSAVPLADGHADAPPYKQVKKALIVHGQNEQAKMDSARVSKSEATSMRVFAAAEAHKSQLEESRARKNASLVPLQATQGENMAYAEKRLRNDLLEREGLKEKQIEQASMVRQAQDQDAYGLAYMQAKAFGSFSRAVGKIQPVEITVEQDWLVKEEKLVVSEGGEKVEYREVETNFLFYRESKYWRNQKEIKAGDYQKVQKLFERPNKTSLWD